MLAGGKKVEVAARQTGVQGLQAGGKKVGPQPDSLALPRPLIQHDFRRAPVQRNCRLVHAPQAPRSIMLSRSIIRRSVLGANSPLPSACARSVRARPLSTVSHTLEPGNVPDELIRSGAHKTAEPARRPADASSPRAPSSASPLPPPTAEAPSQANTPLADSVRELLPLLQAQKPHYITAHVHAKPYLLTAGDTLRLPFLMHDVKPGDVLRLNRASILGSRDFTLRAPAPIKGTRERPGTIMQYLDDRLFVCRATVVGVESEPMRVKEKTKRRNRHTKHVKSKHRYTVLRITELTVKTPEEIEAENAKAKSAVVA